MWTLCVITTLCIFTQAKANLQIRESEYEVVDETKLTTLPIDVQFDQVSLLSCANLCSSSNKTCYSYIYDETTRHCILGSWLVPLKASQQKVQGKIFSSGKFCNTTRNITVLSDGSISDTDLKFCTGQDQLCHVVNSSDPRPLVTLRSGLQVMCDTVTDGGGWTIFQRRVSGTVDFNRNWMEYRNGFGDFSSGNFYLGNENIYLFTSMGERELRVDMTFSETSYFAKYSSFNISSEDDGYRLHVSGYTGNLASGLGGHNGMMFSTPDRDNDLYDPANCASSYHGGWWFRSCISSFLNAEWGTNKFNWNGYRYTSFIEMKFRPA